MDGTLVRVTAILSALAACGDDAGNRKIMDAPAVLHDEGLIDGAANPVTVTVKNSGGAAANIEVYFQNADSSVVATSHTDATGLASQVMDAGGFVTLVNPNGAQQPGFGGTTTFDELDTWAGVKPGDHLVWDTSSNNTSTSVTVQLSLDSAHGTVSSYTVNTTCNGSATISAPSGTGVLTISSSVFFYGCGGTADVLVVANDIDGQALSYFYVPAQPITDGDTIDYTAKTYTAVAQRAFEFDNNPSSDNPITVDDRFVTSRGPIYFVNANAAGTTATTTLGLPALPTGALDIVETDQAATSTDRHTVAWGPTTADYTVDYGASLAGDFSVDPTFDTGTQTLAWTLGTGKPVVFSVSSMSAQRTGLSWSWQIVGPSGTQVTLPTLPTDVADFKFAATDTMFIDGVGIGYLPGGYDAFRADAFAGPPSPTGASGTAAYNLWQQQVTAPPPGLLKKMHVRATASNRVVTPRRVWSKHGSM